ncbi:hypothetical protein NFI95_06500 [Acetobacteraceae bacterium KSS8]|uniref:Uncharacterized protein n=1 Tax=Endosaccharibacter trunci TaxID=2812733 RepID=A0ABT1W5D4_9PROT|nr:hypothetical protein [Acetobacteraceae bacterium KSS8]
MWAPTHGHAEIRTGRFRPDYPSDTYRARCNDPPRDGIAAFYRPAPGWRGDDTVTLRFEEPSGKHWMADFVITTG